MRTIARSGRGLGLKRSCSRLISHDSGWLTDGFAVGGSFVVGVDCWNWLMSSCCRYAPIASQLPAKISSRKRNRRLSTANAENISLTNVVTNLYKVLSQPVER